LKQAAASTSASVPAKRGRGRPRRDPLPEQPTSSKIRQVFDGIELPQFAARRQNVADSHDEDAYGEDDDQNDEDGDLLVMPSQGDTSSLGSSNKGVHHLTLHVAGHSLTILSENHPEPVEEVDGPIIHASLADALNFQAESATAEAK